MAISKKDLKIILEKENKDLKDRLAKESWKVTYDRKADILTLGTKFPKGSGNVYLNEKEGMMIRLGEDKKIYGFVIENYKSVFLKKSDNSPIFWFMFLPYTHLFGRLIFRFVLSLIYICFLISNLALKEAKNFEQCKDDLEEYRNDLVINHELAKAGSIC